MRSIVFISIFLRLKTFSKQIIYSEIELNNVGYRKLETFVYNVGDLNFEEENKKNTVGGYIYWISKQST